MIKILLIAAVFISAGFSETKPQTRHVTIHWSQSTTKPVLVFDIAKFDPKIDEKFALIGSVEVKRGAAPYFSYQFFDTGMLKEDTTYHYAVVTYFADGTTSISADIEVYIPIKNSAQNVSGIFTDDDISVEYLRNPKVLQIRNQVPGWTIPSYPLEAK